MEPIPEGCSSLDQRKSRCGCEWLNGTGSVEASDDYRSGSFINISTLSISDSEPVRGQCPQAISTPSWLVSLQKKWSEKNHRDRSTVNRSGTVERNNLNCPGALRYKLHAISGPAYLVPVERYLEHWSNIHSGRIAVPHRRTYGPSNFVIIMIKLISHFFLSASDLLYSPNGLYGNGFSAIPAKFINKWIIPSNLLVKFMCDNEFKANRLKANLCSASN